MKYDPTQKSGTPDDTATWTQAAQDMGRILSKKNVRVTMDGTPFQARCLQVKGYDNKIVIELNTGDLEFDVTYAPNIIVLDHTVQIDFFGQGRDCNSLELRIVQ